MNDRVGADIGLFVVLEIQVIHRFVENVREMYAFEDKKLADLLDKTDDSYHEGYLEEQQSIEGGVFALGGQLAMVALYQVIELSTKALLRPKYKKKADKFYKFDALKIKIKKDFGVDTETLTNAAAVAEIRLINNAVKHEGRVSPQLAKQFGTQFGWKKGSRLEGLEQAFDRLSPSVKWTPKTGRPDKV
jgi:hypothetical protein